MQILSLCRTRTGAATTQWRRRVLPKIRSCNDCYPSNPVCADKFVASFRYQHALPQRKMKIHSSNEKSSWSQATTSISEIRAKTMNVDKGRKMVPEKDELSRINTFTKYILNEVPVGQLEVKDVVSIKNAMQIYTQSIRSLNVNKLSGRKRSVQDTIRSNVSNMEELLERLLVEEHKQRLRKGGKAKVKVNIIIYKYMLEALALSVENYSNLNGGLDVAERAESWLRRIEEASLWRHKNHLKPDAAIYNSCLLAWSRCDNVNESGRRAEALLQEMIDKNIEPTVITYNRVIHAWARSGGKVKAAQAAESLLETMLTKNSDITPDRYTWHAVMNAWSWSEDKTSSARIGSLINRMMKECDELGKPDLTTYHILLNSYAKSGRKDAVKEAEKILDAFMSGSLDITPNTVTFTIALEILAKSGERGSASKADAILRSMLDFSQTNDQVRPNALTFNVVIDAYAKSRDPKAAYRAEELLCQLEQLYEETNEEDLKPNIVSYTSTIDAIANSARNDSILRAEKIFERVEKRIAEGDKEFGASIIVHSSLINVSCAFVE